MTTPLALLMSAVRALVHARAMHALCPTNAFAANLVAVRWDVCRTLLGSEFHGGRLEAIVTEHAAVRARLDRAGADASPRTLRRWKRDAADVAARAEAKRLLAALPANEAVGTGEAA